MNRSLICGLAAGVALIGLGVAGSRRSDAPVRGMEPGSFAVRNVRVFDGARTIERTTVVVRGGSIVGVGDPLPAGIEIVEGGGRTLLPGLIDAHTHAFGDALSRALIFGVTAELDMFTDHRLARTMREEQARPGGAAARADLFSAGTLVTAPGGHGTEYGLPVPTLASAADAQAFVDARLAEGSDYIKIVYDDGSAYGLRLPTIDRKTLKAAIDAARARDRLALVHIGTQRAAEEAIAAGASGLIHLFADTPASEGFAGRAKRAGVFVVPTLTVIQSSSGTPGSGPLRGDARIEPFLNGAERAALGTSFPARAGSTLDPRHAADAVRRLRAAGVPLLAGTDAPNPGTAHGASMHRELELLVEAGLTPEEALASATSVPARVFGFDDRGRIAPGLRADLLLVEGDPTRDVLATRDIVAVWKRGVRIERRPAEAETAAGAPAAATGEISDFDDGETRAAFGGGWQVSTDARMGGTSEASMRVVGNGATGTNGALEVTGAIAAGAPYPWAGAMFFPAATPMAPADLSNFKEIVFWARGDGREYSLMVFATRLGPVPATYSFTAGAEWREFVVPFPALSGLDGSDIRGVLFSAGTGAGAFRFAIDEVRLR